MPYISQSLVLVLWMVTYGSLGEGRHVGCSMFQKILMHVLLVDLLLLLGIAICWRRIDGEPVEYPELGIRNVFVQEIIRLCERVYFCIAVVLDRTYHRSVICHSIP